LHEGLRLPGLHVDEQDLEVLGAIAREDVRRRHLPRENRHDAVPGRRAREPEARHREDGPRLGRARALLVDARLEVSVRPEPAMACRWPILKNHEHRRSDHDRFAGHDRGRLPGLDLGVPDAGTVGAAVVFDGQHRHPARGSDVDSEVLAGRHGVLDLHVALG
jgi:hypothetical protein